MKNLRKAKKDFDVALAKALKSSERVSELVDDDYTFEEWCNADIDVSPDGEFNRG